MIISSPILPDNESSYWLEAAAPLNLPALNEKIDCDVVIVGGGIAGLTAAYKLKKAGFKVTVLEKNTIGSGTTAGTTGKVTTQHGLIYAELLKSVGEKKTRYYADVSRQAFNDIEELIKLEKIDCGWTVEDNFAYTSKQVQIDSLKEEASVAADMGLPASFEETVALPFEVKGAVKFANQAYFNAVKYTRALAKLVNGDGSYVFENSEAKRIHEGKPCLVKTKNGEVSAKTLVVATKVPAGPLIGRATYASVEYPVTSYITAGRYDGGLRGMYISPDKSNYSILPINTAAGRLLLIGGESHIPGIKRSTPNHKKLAQYSQEVFGVNEIEYRWKAMDYIAYDSLPLVGPLYPWSKNAYFIGGFKKWGLNLSMVAANIITDAIAGEDNKGIKTFSPHRISAPVSFPKAAVKYFK